MSETKTEIRWRRRISHCGVVVGVRYARVSSQTCGFARVPVGPSAEPPSTSSRSLDTPSVKMVRQSADLDASGAALLKLIARGGRAHLPNAYASLRGRDHK